MSILDATFFHDEEAAYTKLESVLWPSGPECPKCGVVGDAHKIAANKAKKVRYGLYRCNSCGSQFTVTVGTVFESSHIELHKWLQAAFLLNSSKKGISARQIERILGVTYKTAWFMCHRLRTAMDQLYHGPNGEIGGQGKVVEADETYFGRKEVTPSRRRSARNNDRAVVSLVERGGEVRSFHVERADKRSIQKVLKENVAQDTRLHTDESNLYYDTWALVTKHEVVKHTAKEYVRGDVHTNSAEGFFGIFKRGMKGIYQHCSEKHLHRYLAEFDFRYNNREALGIDDLSRTANALKAAKGKRLTYRRTNEARA
ncbi:MAG: IS1595 family transposase [Alphaproteobacteria bacterium]|nr:IS1595 family transposase [Alphaproteobacteria bacterium]